MKKIALSALVLSAAFTGGCGVVSTESAESLAKNSCNKWTQVTNEINRDIPGLSSAAAAARQAADLDSDYRTLGRAMTDMVDSVKSQDLSTFTVVAGVVFDEYRKITDADAQLEEMIDERYGN